MWNWSVRISGWRPAIARKRSSQYGIVIAMPFDFVADVTCRALRVRGEIERELQDAVDPLAREHGFLEHDLALGPLEHPPADRRILALGVLADDDEIDVAGLAVRERARDPGHQPARPQVHVLVEAAAELDQRSPQRDVVRDDRRPAHRAVEDRVVRRQRLEPVLRHHPPVLRVVVAVPVELAPFDRDRELARRGLERAQSFGDDFLADAVARHDGDAMRGH